MTRRIFKNYLLLLFLFFAFSAGIANVAQRAFADDTTTSVIVGNASPTFGGDMTLNSDGAITLLENASTTVYATSTITDSNGCNTLLAVTGTLYRSGVGVANCNQASQVVNNYCVMFSSCATSTIGGETCDGGSDTSAKYACKFILEYYADATAGNSSQSSYSAENWSTTMAAGDGLATTTANHATGVEMNVTTALDVTGSFSYNNGSSMAANTNTGQTNGTTTVKNTGNELLKTQLAGQAMSYSSYSIPVGQQQYGTAPFAWSAGNLTGVPTDSGVVWSKPYSTTTPLTRDISWGIAIPNGQQPGTYSGTNSSTAAIGI